MSDEQPTPSDEHQPELEPAATPNGGPADDRKAGLIACALGVTLGALLVFLVPSSWIFVQPDAHAGHAASGDVAQYACPMFCVVMDHKPENEKCPVCGMSMTVVSGQSTLDRGEQKMIGLEADSVRRMPLVRNLRIVGEVDYDETRIARITTRVGGWLETVWIDSTWASVSKGEPLAASYSPELYAAEQEYLVAWRAAQSDTGDRGTVRPTSLLRAAERRLELLGVGEQEIAELQRSGTPRDSVVLRAPFGGVVVDRRALEGASVAKGASLYTVADLSKVWVQGLLFESDLPWVRTGQSVRLEAEGGSGPIDGVVAFVDPAIDRVSRTARVRIEVDNAPNEGGNPPLRIGQRVDAWVHAEVDARGRLSAPNADSPTRPLAVPRSAVLRTGERSLVYVLFTEEDTDGGRQRNYHLDPENLPEKLWYEPVQVRVGPIARSGGDGAVAEYYPVLGVVPPKPLSDPETGETREVLSLRRLSEGVTVVSKGNLLLDSQAQLAGKPSLLFPEGNRGASADPHAGH